MDNTIVDFRVARVENYYILGLYRDGEKIPYEWKSYDDIDLLMFDLYHSIQGMEHNEQVWDIDILDLLNMRKEEDE